MNLLLRVIVALIFIPIIIFSIIKGGYFMDAFLTVIALGSIYEYRKIVGKDVFPATIIIFVLSSILAIVLKQTDLILPLTFAILPFAFRGVVKEKGDDFTNNLRILSLNVLPFVYALFPLILFSTIYSDAKYANYLPHLGIFLLVNIWVNDSFAYFCGRLFGKRRLAPKISPKKSVEGFIGGMVFAVIASVIYFNLYSFLPVYHLIILSIIISIFGPVGDLFESVIKREFGVKDSSNLIPGHGGILDRFDSFLFTIPFYYLYIKFFI